MENKNLRNPSVPYSANATTLNNVQSPTPLFADVSRPTPPAPSQTPTPPVTTPVAGVPLAPPGLAPLPAAPPPTPTPLPSAQVINMPKPPRDWKKLLIRSGIVVLVLLLVGAGVLLFNTLTNKPPATLNSVVANTTIPLSEFASSGSLSLLGAQSLSVNGQLRANESFVLAPQALPTNTNSERGQLYYDKNTNQLAYYNGNQYVQLPGTGTTVQTIQGQSGNVTLVGGNGVTITGTTLTNSGVTSVGGQTGDIAVGNGLAMNGGTIQNTGLVSAVSGTPLSLSVTNDGNGNITISSFGAGTGTVQSPGGTNGHLALFTAAQTIEDSIVTQSGITVTVGGNLSVTGGSLTLANALTVPNGGTGAQTLAAGGVIIGNGTSALTSVVAGGSGLCLMSTGGTPAFSACPGGGIGVTSLDGLTGVLTLANSTGVGTTVTINDATTAAKGIASYNSTNFSVSGGAVNTIQNINTGATPTFAGVNTNNITPSSALTVGISAQTALLQGSTTTITSSGAGASLILNSGGSIELQDNTNITGNGTLTGDLAVNGGDITSSSALNITPTGTLTAGSATQTLTLQGNASTVLKATNGGNTTTVAFTSPTAATTLNFPALAAGTYTICTTSGNCAGAGVTLQAAYDNSSTPEIVLDATRAALTIQDNAVAIGGRLLEVQANGGATTYFGVTATGITVTGTAVVTGNINSSGGSLQTNSTTRIDGSGNATNIANLTLSGAISGGTTYSGSGNINTTGGVIQTGSTTRIDNSGNLVNIASLTTTGNATIQGGSITLGTTSQSGSLVVNDGSSNTGTLQVAALGQNTVYTLPDPGAGTAAICLSTGNCAGAGGGVTGTGTNNRITKFTSTGSTVGDSTITDNGTVVTTSVNMVIQGGTATLGTTSQAGSLLLHDGNGQTTTLQAGDSAGNLTFILPTTTGSATQCLKQSGTGNQLMWDACEGGTGGISTTLQQAYGNGNAITTTDARNVNIVLADTTTDSNFAISIADNSTGYFSLSRADGAGTSDPAQLLLIDNLDATRAVAAGIKIQAAAGGITTAIDASDAEIGDALNVGANNIVGTTGNLTFSNFSMTGSTGNIVAGTYNSQTISSTANFTGTVTVASNLTLTAGDIAVNGGDITATGALNITPGGTLTVGATGQALTLQGSASTKITATGSGFTTTVGFNGTPTADVIYNFDRTTAAGTYTICSSVGNCAGAGGGVTGSGTNNQLAKFTSTGSTIGNSTITDDGATVTTTVNMIVQGGSSTLGTSSQIGSLVLNDGNGQTTTLQAGDTSGNITFILPTTIGSTNQCLKQSGTGNQLFWDNCDGGGGGTSTTLQQAYNNGNTIATSDARDISMTLANTTSDANLAISIADDSTGFLSLSRANGTGTNSPAQLFLADNLDADQAVAAGIKIQSAAGGITTAIDASDAEIGNALNAGANDIIGTTGNLTFSNFTVTGSTGALTGGTYNSQTISSTASFTGTVTVASNLTLTAGDIAVNGGDITATGALNITPGAALTVGATAQNTTLQGNANTKITATSSGFTTTVGFTGTPTGAVNYTFDSAATPGTYAICTAVGNCLGGSGGANAALSNLSSVAINTTLLPGAAGAINLGSGTLPFGELFVAGTSGTPGTNNFKITGASTGGLRTITLPDASGTVCINTNNCSYAPSSGSANYIQNQTGSNQTADFQISGSGRAATFNGTTGINTGLVGGTQRIDASGNLVNIGDLTATGGITVASSGAGNITLNSAGTIELQDATNVTGTFATTSTINVGALGTTNTATYLCRNGTGFIAACSTNATGSAFVQGGNSFGATATIGSNDANDVAIERNNVTQLTVGNGVVTFASDVDLTLQGSTAYISNPQGQTNSESYGANAGVTGAQAVALGASAQAAADGTAVGKSASAGAQSVSVGQGTSAGIGSVVIGNAATSANTNSIVLGANATTTANNQLVVGGSVAQTSNITDAYFGAGVTSSSASTAGVTLNATGGSGTNNAGASLTLAGGKGTGTAAGGSLNLQVATPGLTGSTLNPLATVASFSGTNGSALFKNSVDSTTGFQIQNAGATVNALTVDTTGTTAVTVGGTLTVSGGNATLGTTSTQGQLILHDGNGQTATISIGNALASNTVIALPTAVGSTDTFCLLTLANCSGGVTSIGTINSQTKSANGAVIASGALVLQTADTSFPGLVSTGTQTFAGLKTFNNNTVIQGQATDSLIVQSYANGVGAVVLNLQQSDADSVLRVTDTGVLAVGNSTGVAATIAVGKGDGNYGEIQASNLTGTRNFQLPNQNGTFCVDTGNCSSTLQTAYNAAVSPSTTPEIKLNSTNNGIEIQDADTTLGSSQNFLSLRAPNSGGLGNIVVGFGIPGNLFMKPTSNSTELIDVNNAAGNNVFTVDTTNSRVGIGLGGAAVPGFTLDVGGTLNVSGAATLNSTLAVTSTSTFTGQLTANGGISIGSNQSISLAGGSSNITATGASTATTGTTEATPRSNVTTVTLTAAGSFANNDVIFLNNAGQDYYTRIVSGGGTTTLTVSPAVSYDASASVTKYTVQNIGATTTDYTTLSNRFFQGYFLGGVVTGAGSTTLSDGRLNSTTRLNFNAVDFSLQDTTGASTFLAVDSTGINVNGGTGTVTAGTVSATNLSTSGTFNGNTFSSSALTFSAASGATVQAATSQALTLTSHAAATWSTDSGALTVQSAADLNLKATGNLVVGTSDTTGTQLVLDTKTGSGDPTGANGGMYYNSNSNTFRCYENGAWYDCLSRHKIVLTGDVSNSATPACTNADITGLSFSVASGVTYRWHAQIAFSANATTTGSQWTATTPATTTLAMTASAPGGTNSETYQTINTSDGGNCSTASAFTAGNLAMIDGVVTPSAGGTVQMRFASEVAGAAITAKAGSTLEWW